MALIVFGLIALINYFIIFGTGSFKEKTPSTKFGFGVAIYMIISILIVIYFGSLLRERNLQENQRQQTKQKL